MIIIMIHFLANLSFYTIFAGTKTTINTKMTYTSILVFIRIQIAAIFCVKTIRKWHFTYSRFFMIRKYSQLNYSRIHDWVVTLRFNKSYMRNIQTKNKMTTQ